MPFDIKLTGRLRIDFPVREMESVLMNLSDSWLVVSYHPLLVSHFFSEPLILQIYIKYFGITINTFNNNNNALLCSKVFRDWYVHVPFGSVFLIQYKRLHFNLEN